MTLTAAINWSMLTIVTVLEWVDGLYEEQIYQGSDRIVSPRFPELHLTAAQILSAGR
ncbi:hypothetical protein H6G00_27995 [Leptolyngbya sp. FACHB-541]|uniref:hypothetical protein n=1 Tax=Leptolyngbya sp. FACHB-541 TaxID=2692810 RepID=UPI0016827F33|nr:hypothetical protein [Leptolyngbya sp. FACHB-541]MBD2000399.1 hypothetical protein [Leptolyngbya sp. FACHB-541]